MRCVDLTVVERTVGVDEIRALLGQLTERLATVRQNVTDALLDVRSSTRRSPPLARFDLDVLIASDPRLLEAAPGLGLPASSPPD